jgi:hypothetical protein
MTAPYRSGDHNKLWQAAKKAVSLTVVRDLAAQLQIEIHIRICYAAFHGKILWLEKTGKLELVRVQ